MSITYGQRGVGRTHRAAPKAIKCTNSFALRRGIGILTDIMSLRMDGKMYVRLALVLVSIVYLGATTNRGVIDYDEGYYVQPAMRMAQHGDWATPYANDVRFLEKPPFLYWVTAAGFKAFGVREFAMRLPTALAVIALVIAVMQAASLALGSQSAGIAGLCTAFSIGTYLFTRETLHDVWLVLFLTVAMSAFLRWRLDASRPLGAALLFYAALAGGMMCKSLIGVAFPVGIVVLFFIWERKLPEWRSLHLLPGILLFLALTVPWHWLAELRNEGFLEFFFVEEQFLRFLGRRELPVLWSVPLVTFWALVPLWFFPWIVFVPAAFSSERKTDGDKTRALFRLAIIWIIVVIGFFSFSARLEHYVFPALPAFSLLVAVAFKRKEGSRAILCGYRVLAVLGMIALIFGIVAGFWLAMGNMPQANVTVSSNRIAENDFSIMAEMPLEIIRGLIAPAAVTILALAAGFWIALKLEKSRRHQAAALAVAAVMITACATTHWSLNICEDLISSKKFGQAVAMQAQPGDRLVVIGDYESANSLNFYQPLRVEVVDGTAYALLPGLKYPDAPKILLTQAEFMSAWQSSERVFALLPEERAEELMPGGVRVLSVLHRILVRNH